MPPGSMHTCIATEPTITVAMQTFTSVCAARAVEIAIHSFVMGDAFTASTATVSEERWLLVRLFIFQAQALLHGHGEQDHHVFDLRTDHGVNNFIMLRSFVILALVFDAAAFTPAAQPDPSNDPCSRRELRQLICAWDLVIQMDHHVRSQYDYVLKPDRPKAGQSFEKMAIVSKSVHSKSTTCSHDQMQSSVGYLAAVIYSYWLEHKGKETAALLEERIVQALHAFDGKGHLNPAVDAVPSLHFKAYTNFRERGDFNYDRFTPYRHEDPPFSLRRIHPE